MLSRWIYIAACIIYLVLIGVSLVYMYEHYRPIPETGQTPQRPRSEKPEDKEFADMLASGNIHTAPKYHDMDLPFEYKYFDYLCRGIPDSLDAKRHHPKVIFTQ